VTLTVGRLVAAGVGPTQAKLFLEPLLQVCERFDIDTPAREAGFVSQCIHESGGFVHLEESLYYRNPVRLMKIWPRSINSDILANGLVGNPKGLANTVYANKNGNGPFNSGDGWKYRGRGLIQLTGRANYTAAALDLGEPYIDQPDLVAFPPDAALTAGWYWDRARCNTLADAADVDAITRAINGPGMVGKEERRELYRRALNAFR
jgi:putative chitinase